MAAMRAFWNSPVGPKTTHFWGPVANWGFVLAVIFLVPFMDVGYKRFKILIRVEYARWMAWLHSLEYHGFNFLKEIKDLSK